MQSLDDELKKPREEAARGAGQLGRMRRPLTVAEAAQRLCQELSKAVFSLRCSRPKRALDDAAEDYAVLVQEPEQLKRQVVKTAAKLPAGDRGDGPPEVAELRASWSGCADKEASTGARVALVKVQQKEEMSKAENGPGCSCRFNLTDATRRCGGTQPIPRRL